LKEGKGNVQLGQDILNNADSAFSYLRIKMGSATRNKSLAVFGNANVVGKVKESGDDLLPSGSIIMWSGATIPAGWKLCDGTNSTANLLNRLIYGGQPGGTHYNTAQGSDTRSLTVSNIPNHTHKGSTDALAGTAGGAHNYTGHTTSRADDYDNDTPHNFLTYDGTNSYLNYIDIRSNVSEHTPDITTDECLSCAAALIDMKSAYFVLAFIMKI